MIRTVAQIGDYVAAALIDSISLDLVKKHSGANSGIGINRFWQIAGAALGPPFAGILMDAFNNKSGNGDQRTYLPGFLTNAGAGLICALIVVFMEVPNDIKAHAVMKNVAGLLKNPPFVTFLIAVTLSGNGSFIF